MNNDDDVRAPSADAVPTKRRHRAMRTAASVAIVLFVAGAVVLVVAQPWNSAEPVASPSATKSVGVTPTDTATATPSPTASAVVIGTVTAHPRLPPAKPLERGLLAAAGEGWSLMQYGATQLLEPFTAGPEVLYLVSPDGVVYQAHDFGVGAHVRLVDWAPGSSLALFLTGFENNRNGLSTVQVLDLETGSTVGSFTLEPGFRAFAASFTRPTGQNVVVSASDGAHGWLKRFSRDGHELATLLSDTDPSLPANGIISFNPTWTYSNDGTYIVVDHHGLKRIVSDASATTPVPLPAGTLECVPMRWWDTSHLLARCTEDLGPNPDDLTVRRTSSNMWLISMSGQAPTRLSSFVMPKGKQPVDFGITNAWDVAGTHFAQWTDDCGAAASFGTLNASGAYAVLTNGVAVMGNRGTTFVGMSWETCGDLGADFVTVNGADGAVRVVVPRVGDAEGVQKAVVR